MWCPRCLQDVTPDDDVVVAPAREGADRIIDVTWHAECYREMREHLAWP